MKTRYVLGIIVLVVMSVLFSGCTSSTQVKEESSHEQEAKITEQNQQNLIASSPAPIVTKSLERENLIRRINMINDENKVFYVYLISYGKVMAFYTAKGKVSSLNSYLTNMEQQVYNQDCYKATYSEDHSGCFYTAEAPDLDGSYGHNVEGIFFFTTDGAYVEWSGEYMTSDYPLSLSTPPELVINIDEKA